MPNRTTISAVVADIVQKLTDNLVGSPPAKPFRSLVFGSVEGEQGPRPILGLRLLATRAVGVTDDDKIQELTLVLGTAVDVIKQDPHEELLPILAALDDYLDGIRDTGLVDGAEGMDNGAWKFIYPESKSGARVLTAEMAVTVVLRIARENNG